MSDLDTEILELKTEGKSLWEIASVLGISHEGERKKLRNLANRGQLSTKAREHELTLFADGGVVSTCVHERGISGGRFRVWRLI